MKLMIKNETVTEFKLIGDRVFTEELVNMKVCHYCCRISDRTDRTYTSCPKINSLLFSTPGCSTLWHHSDLCMLWRLI